MSSPTGRRLADTESVIRVRNTGCWFKGKYFIYSKAEECEQVLPGS